MAGLTNLQQKTVRSDYALARERYQVPSWLPKVLRVVGGHNTRLPWISGYSSGMRELKDGGSYNNVVAQFVDFTPVPYMDGIDIPLELMRRDETMSTMRGDIMAELVDGEMEHWEELFMNMLIAGATTEGYDGQYIFDTDHSDSGGTYSTNQSNKINVDISASPVVINGSVTVPSVEELQWAVCQAIEKMVAFRDSHGRYKNRGLKEVCVFLSNSMWTQAKNASSQNLTGYGADSILKAVEEEVKIKFVASPRLSSFTDDLIVVRTDSPQPFAMGLEEDLEPEIAESIKDPSNSDYCDENECVRFKIRRNRKLKAMDWRKACMVTLT